LVVEAAKKSGTQYTAEQAKAQKKPLFAVPGPVDSSLSEGTNRLLSQGAVMAVSPAEMLKKIGIFPSRRDATGGARPPASGGAGAPTGNLSGPELKVWEHLKLSPLDFDDLCKMTGLEVSNLNIALTNLEVKGMVKLEGGIYSVVGGN
jgi:DNA processing protein